MQFTHGAPAHVDALRDAFGCTVVFSALHNATIGELPREEPFVTEVRQAVIHGFQDGAVVAADVGEIGYGLGFADAGSFTRAFKRWSGTTAAGFRKAGR